MCQYVFEGKEAFVSERYILYPWVCIEMNNTFSLYHINEDIQQLLLTQLRFSRTLIQQQEEVHHIYLCSI
jgi:hypothetical protein